MNRFLAILIFFSFSCNTTKKINEDYTIIKFRESFPSGNKTILQKYNIEVPRFGKLTKGTYDFTGDYHSEYRIVYVDSSILYIGNDNLNGSKLNVVNRVNIGVRGITKNLNDSLYLEGVQENGRYWKESILGEIVIGYVNVKKIERDKFDKALQSLIKQ